MELCFESKQTNLQTVVIVLSDNNIILCIYPLKRAPKGYVMPLWLASRSIRDILENFRVRRRASRSETPDRRGTDMVGVFSSLEAVIIISRSRGMPSVTLAPAPAKWNVLRVLQKRGEDWSKMSAEVSGN